MRVGHRSVAIGLRSNCPMAIWVDGLRLYAPDASSAGVFTRRIARTPIDTGSNAPPNIDQWSVADLQAVEVFAGPAQTPPQFQVTGSTCGTILLWSRGR